MACFTSFTHAYRYDFSQTVDGVFIIIKTLRIYTDVCVRGRIACWAFIAFDAHGLAIHAAAGVVQENSHSLEAEAVVRAATWAEAHRHQAIVYTDEIGVAINPPDHLAALLAKAKLPNGHSIIVERTHGQPNVTAFWTAYSCFLDSVA